jgi:transposase InsO family protein
MKRLAKMCPKVWNRASWPGASLFRLRTRQSPSAASDQGVQFGSWAFTRRAKDSGLLASMGSIGDSMIEAFWSRMQVELLDRKQWNTRLELANAIFEYLGCGTTGSAVTASSGG